MALMDEFPRMFEIVEPKRRWLVEKSRHLQMTAPHVARMEPPQQTVGAKRRTIAGSAKSGTTATRPRIRFAPSGNYQPRDLPVGRFVDRAVESLF